MDLKKRVRSYSKENAPKNRKLELRIDVELKRGTPLSDSYMSNNELAKIKVEKTLVCTTDSKLKDIKEELISAIQSQFDDIEKQIENSEFLSDGFWSSNSGDKDNTVF